MRNEASNDSIIPCVKFRKKKQKNLTVLADKVDLYNCCVYDAFALKLEEYIHIVCLYKHAKAASCDANTLLNNCKLMIYVSVGLGK